MKVDKVVKKETINIAIGILVCSLILQVIFMIFGRYNLAVFLGTIYGGGISLLNFFLMGLTVQKVTRLKNENMAKKKMQFSYSLRQLGLMFLLGFGMYIAANYETFHWLPILLAITYPRITIAFVGLFQKEWRVKKGDVA